MLAVIHAAPSIAWHAPFARKMVDGLKNIGVQVEVTAQRERLNGGLPILLGTNSWRAVERTGPYLLVDRCSFGDTNHWVTLVRDGHGRRGDHRVPHNVPPYRWEKYAVPLSPWRDGRRRVLCGQIETYSPDWSSLQGWYDAARKVATHFRPHPVGENPTALPSTRTWSDVGQAITLNSSVAVEAVLMGVPTVTMDEGSMAWDVSSHDPAEIVKPVRLPWLHWLAWTQWSHDEIAEGKPWAHLLS